MSAAPRLLDPGVIARLSGMDLKARLVVEGFLVGLHRSPHRGFSVEFAEHRPFMPGDPPRLLDWKAYARNDRLYVKEFVEETNLRAYLLLDASGSMGLGTAGFTKLAYGAHLAAALSYLMLGQKDSVGLMVFDAAVRRYVPPRSSRQQLHRVLQELTHVKAGERTDVAGSLHRLAERIRRRGLIILISDLLDEPGAVLAALRHFRHKKHELIVFHVTDPAEMTLPMEEEVMLRDMETGQELLTQPWQVRSHYLREVEAWRARYRRACRESGVDYVPLDTSVPYDHALSRYLEKRRRLS